MRPPLPDPSGREATLSPVYLPQDAPDSGALRWTASAIALASAFLLLFNAGAIRGWANELAPGPMTEPMIAAADAWHGLTERLGLDAPIETMRGWWRAAQGSADKGGRQEAPPAGSQPRPGERGPPDA